MWDSVKSVQLSLVCTKVVIALVIACACAMPFLSKSYFGYSLIPIEAGSLFMFIAILYACCVPAMAALICLHILLGNIKREKVFVSENVKLLRIISWCCFAAAFILMFAAWQYLLLGLTAVAIAFIGLILRVVKNVIEEAARIKAENDLTI